MTRQSAGAAASRRVRSSFGTKELCGERKNSLVLAAISPPDRLSNAGCVVRLTLGAGRGRQR
jgi:hypothetical protein